MFDIDYRKFLIKKPLGWYGEFALHRFDKIQQSSWHVIINNEPCFVRCLESSSWSLPEKIETKHILSKTTIVRPGISIADDKKISHYEYCNGLSKVVENSRIVKSTMYKTVYHGKTSIIEKFALDLKGLMTLAVEIEDWYEEPKILPFIDEVKEITSDDRFSEDKLASRNVSLDSLI